MTNEENFWPRQMSGASEVHLYQSRDTKYRITPAIDEDQESVYYIHVSEFREDSLVRGVLY